MNKTNELSSVKVSVNLLQEQTSKINKYEREKKCQKLKKKI